MDIGAGTITLEEPPKKKDGTTSAGPISTLENQPDFPAEVAWLSRSIVFDAETRAVQKGHGYWWCDRDSDPKIEGGHMIISHTPGVAQMIEGVEFKNFGQGGTLGRYVRSVYYLECSVCLYKVPRALTQFSLCLTLLTQNV